MTNREADLKDKQIKSTEEFEIKYDSVRFRFLEVNSKVASETFLYEI